MTTCEINSTQKKQHLTSEVETKMNSSQTQINYLQKDVSRIAESTNSLSCESDLRSEQSDRIRTFSFFVTRIPASTTIQLNKVVYKDTDKRTAD